MNDHAAYCYIEVINASTCWPPGRAITNRISILFLLDHDSFKNKPYTKHHIYQRITNHYAWMNEIVFILLDNG